jgi:hypothetical protein
MFSKKLNSEVSYPFIPEVPDRKYIAGIMDIHLVVSGASIGTTASTYKPYYAYLYSITQISSTTEYVFYAVSSGKYYTFTFTVPWTMGFGAVQNSPSEEARGVLLINATYNYRLSNLSGISESDFELEPGTQVWLEKQIRSVTFVNEWRDFNPNNRTNLTNSALKTFTNSETIEIGSGYNTNINYSSGMLILDGNAGNGKGLAPDNMWDSGPSWDTSQDGLLMVNGIVPNSSGDIPIDKSATVGIVQREGYMGIEI